MADLGIAKNIGVKSAGIGEGLSSRSVDSLRNRDSAAEIGRDGKAIGLDFKKSLADTIAQTPVAPTASAAMGTSLSKVVSGAGAESLKFSAHAVDRMKSRGISFDPEVMKGIESAVSRAAAKGSRDTLVLTGDNALIVSVKNNTVVTVMDKNAMRENVFTNIDSTVVV